MSVIGLILHLCLWAYVVIAAAYLICAVVLMTLFIWHKKNGIKQWFSGIKKRRQEYNGDSMHH